MQEAIKDIEFIKGAYENLAKNGADRYSAVGENVECAVEVKIHKDLYLRYAASLEMAVVALKEVQRYRAIGTVEECEAAMKKKEKPTNADRIRAMSIDDLAMVIMCPYDTAGEPDEIMPCAEQTGQSELVAVKNCVRCCKEWLQKEVRVVDGKRGTDAVPEAQEGSRESGETD